MASKHVVQFRVSVKLHRLCDCTSKEALVVEYKRGKQRGVGPPSTQSGGIVVWKDVEFHIGCSMYYHPKKKSFDEKDLVLTVQRAGGKALGKTKMLINRLANEMGDRVEVKAARKDALDGLGVLEFLVTLRKLDGEEAASALSASLALPRTLAPVKSSPLLTSGPSSTHEQHEELAESPLQAISVEDATADRPYTMDVPKLSLSAMEQVAEPPPIVIPMAKSPRAIAVRATVERHSSMSQSMSFAQAPSPLTTPLHSRGPSIGASLGRTSDSIGDVAPPSPAKQAGEKKKKSNLLGGGHRRGKSHAVTPEELKGLTALELRPQSSSNLGAPASGATQQKKGKSRLFHNKKPSGTAGSVPQLSPRSVTASSNSATPAAVRPVNLLIRSGEYESSSSASSFDEEEPAAGGGGISEWLGTKDARTSSHDRRLSVGYASPQLVVRGSSGDAMSAPRQVEDTNVELEVYKRQVQEQQKKRDQLQVLQQFVFYSQVDYTSEMPISAFVLFKCLVQWDSFDPLNAEFREQILEGLEKLTKSGLDLTHSLYWLSSVLSLLCLLRNNLPPIPRSEVSKNNTLIVFQERLRGLVMAFLSRVVALSMHDLRGIVAPAVLEQNSLLDSAGPSTPQQRNVPPARKRVAMSECLAVLDSLKESCEVAKVPASIVSQLYARLAHALAVHTLNVLLDNNPRLCTFSNGLQMKKPIMELKSWFSRNLMDSATTMVAPLEDVVNVLCMNKSALVEAEVRREVCPHLSEAQLAQLLLLYSPDDFDSEPIHPGVLAKLCGDMQPNEWKMSEEVRDVVSLDMTDCSYELECRDCPEVLGQLAGQPSLEFLVKPVSDRNSSQVLPETKWGLI